MTQPHAQGCPAPTGHYGSCSYVMNMPCWPKYPLAAPLPPLAPLAPLERPEGTSLRTSRVSEVAGYPCFLDL